MDRAAALKFNSYRFKFLLTEYLDKCSVIFAGRVFRQKQYTLERVAWYVNVQSNVHWGSV